MKQKLHISGAGNVVVPAYLALQQMGLRVRCEKQGTEAESWIAESDAAIFSAPEVVMLLGLAKLGELRGEHWQASDAEIQDFYRRLDMTMWPNNQKLSHRRPVTLTAKRNCQRQRRLAPALF